MCLIQKNLTVRFSIFGKNGSEHVDLVHGSQCKQLIGRLKQ